VQKLADFSVFLARSLPVIRNKKQGSQKKRGGNNHLSTPSHMRTNIQINRTTSLVLSFIFFSIVCFWHVGGQTVAIGHITAEVVESVSASSNVTTSFSFQNPNSQHFSPSKMNQKRVEMGDVALNSGQNVSCSVIIKPAVMTDASGNRIVIEPTASFSGRQDTNRADGSQNLHLSCNAMIAKDLNNGHFNGSYTMVFAYN
jgi:hypothetical protein